MIRRTMSNRLLRLSYRFSSTYTLPTVYALSTHLARSAIGVVRISGSDSKEVLRSLTKQKLPQERVASVRKLYQPNSNTLLDEALTIVLTGPKTYTGEDIVELHLHGGIAVIKAVLKAIEILHTPQRPIRYAEAGEFSKRAFQNGRFDLTEIEGIGELIDAETESQRIGAITSATGANKILFAKWRDSIVHNVGMLAAIIDFADDTEIEEIGTIFANVGSEIDKLKFEVLNYLRIAGRSDILLRGIKLALVGPPNAGKSSILNTLANSDAAIVSDIAGTTRDVLNIPLDIKGYKVVVVDTAGIRDLQNTDKIETEGIKRAKIKSLEADLVIIVLGTDNLNLEDSLRTHIKSLKNNKEVFVALNKCDLVDKHMVENIKCSLSKELQISTSQIITISCVNGSGIDDFGNLLVKRFKHITSTETTSPVILSERVKDILKKDVLHGLEQFQTFRQLDDVVLASEALAQAIDGIGKITGEAVGVEELLGVVFSNFCVGK